MVKYRKRGRKTNRKRRAFKKRSSRRGGGYDGALKIKVHNTYTMYHTSAIDHADFTVNWAGNGSAAGAGGTARVTVCNEMTTYAPLYNMYRVTGCKVKIIPIN